VTRAVVFALLLTAPGLVQASEPPPFHVTAPTRPIALKEVMPTLAPDVTIGSYGRGTFCLGHEPITVERLFEKNPTKRYAAAFAAEAAVAGYAIAGHSLFGPKGRVRPEIEIGAAITALSASGCFHDKNVRGKNSHMSASVTETVDWQVFDPGQKKLLFRLSVQGKGDGSGRDAFGEAARVAFENAARAMLVDPGFLAAVRKTDAP
jgi:hypothetical protein